MIKSLKIKQEFLEALRERNKEYGRGFQTFIATDIGKTKGAFTSIFKYFKNEIELEKVKLSFDLQVEIAEACGSDYIDFIQRGRDLIAGNDSSPKHPAPLKADSFLETKEPEKVQQLLPAYEKTITLLEKDNDRLEARVAAVEEDKFFLRADLERERKEHKEAMAELREDYKELKAELKELRQENKQLLESYRALKIKAAQSDQSPDKPTGKKAVNQ